VAISLRGLSFLACLFAASIAAVEAATVDPAVSPDDRDVYGGWKGVRSHGTGFFRAERIEGLWWFITPGGHGFLSKGVNGVKYSGWQTKGYREAILKRHGSEEAWARATADRLRAWGFNLIGPWSSPLMYQQKLAYVINLQIGFRSRLPHLPEMNPRAAFKLPDVWSPEFKMSADKRARELCAPRRDDSWLFGYHTDNELAVLGYNHKGFHPLPVLRVYLRQPAAAPGHAKAAEFLRERYDGDGGAFARVWDSGGIHFDRMADTDDVWLRVVDRDQAGEDCSVFIARVLDQYGRVCRDAIRKYDPNHMILGIRQGGLVNVADDRVNRALGLHVEAISQNCYLPSPPIVAFEHNAMLARKPLILSEFSFRAADAEPGGNRRGIPIDQKHRAVSLELYLRGLFTSPWVGGYQWFNWLDGFDTKNCGLVTRDDEPFKKLTAAFTRANRLAEPIHAGKRFQLPIESSRAVVHPAPE